MSGKMMIPAAVVLANGEGEGSEAQRCRAAPAPGLVSTKGGPWSPSHVRGWHATAAACSDGESSGNSGEMLLASMHKVEEEVVGMVAAWPGLQAAEAAG